MLDIKDFLEWVVDDDLIRSNEIRVIDCDMDDFFDQKFRMIPDDYDQDTEYGLYTGDSENAKDHLIGILKSSYHNKENVEKTAGAVARDLNNWLRCIDIFQYDTVLRKVLRIMVYLGYGEVVCKQMEREYQSFKEYREERMHEDVWRPDYVELYLDLGDYCLFETADDGLAMRFYHLAACDWYGLKTNHKERVSQKREKEWKRMDQLVLELDACYALLPMQSDKNRLAKTIVEKYNRYIKYQEEGYVYYKKQLELLLDFVKCREEYWKGTRLQAKRMLLVISHRLFEDAIAEMIITLYEEKIDSAAFEKRMLDCLDKSEDKSLIPIRRLVKQYREEAEIMNAVIFLIRTRFQMKEVLSGLKITKLKEELAYYTSLDTFCYMLPDWNQSDEKGIDRFSVMNIAYMNDPNEGKMLKNAFQRTDESGCWSQYLARSEGVRKRIEFPYAFLKCFTPLVDDLPMWDMYGDSAKGCCVVLNAKTFFAEEKKYATQLYRVCYLSIDGETISVEYENNTKLDDTASIEDAIAEIRKIGAELFREEAKGNKLYHRTSIEFMEMLDQISYLFKSADYKHEQEVRLLYVYPKIYNDFQHTKEEWPKLYVRPDFPVHIKELIMGPKCVDTYKIMPYLQEQIAKMCEQESVDLPKITISNIQYH